jgi:hypothetical protein
LALKVLENRIPALIKKFSDSEINALYNTQDSQRYREILETSWQSLNTVYVPFVESFNGSVRNKWVNVATAGFRKNKATDSDQLSTDERLRYIFGGSTTYGLGVSDEETIPAFLEKRLEELGGPKTRVVNWGSVGHFSTQELILFQHLLAREPKPWGAIFVDGLNDFYFCKTPDESQLTPSLRRAASALQASPVIAMLASNLHVVKLAGVLAGRTSIDNYDVSVFCRSREELMKVVERLETNHAIIRAIGRQFGIKVLFVRQPVPTFDYDNTKRAVQFPEERLSYHRNSANGYALLEELEEKKVISSENLLSLTHLKIEQNQYIDTVHYSPQFNDRIAQSIATEVKKW